MFDPRRSVPSLSYAAFTTELSFSKNRSKERNYGNENGSCVEAFVKKVYTRKQQIGWGRCRAISYNWLRVIPTTFCANMK